MTLDPKATEICNKWQSDKLDYPQPRGRALSVANDKSIQSGHRKKPKGAEKGPCVALSVEVMCLALTKAVVFQRTFLCDIQGSKIFMTGHLVFMTTFYNQKFTDTWILAKRVKVSGGHPAKCLQFQQRELEPSVEILLMQLSIHGAKIIMNSNILKYSKYLSGKLK